MLFFLYKKTGRVFRKDDSYLCMDPETIKRRPDNTLFVFAIALLVALILGGIVIKGWQEATNVAPVEIDLPGDDIKLTDTDQGNDILNEGFGPLTSIPE